MMDGILANLALESASINIGLISVILHSNPADVVV